MGRYTNNSPRFCSVKWCYHSQRGQFRRPGAGGRRTGCHAPAPLGVHQKHGWPTAIRERKPKPIIARFVQIFDYRLLHPRANDARIVITCGERSLSSPPIACQAQRIGHCRAKLNWQAERFEAVDLGAELITRRSVVRIHSPLLLKNAAKRGVFVSSWFSRS